jgi:hypothetical protein
MDVNFWGINSGSGQIGLQMGSSGFQVSETSIINCVFTNLAYGTRTFNDNSVDHVLINCSISNCGSGIAPSTGAYNAIIECSFAGNTIDIDNTSGRSQPIAVIGCRTESPYFIKATRGMFHVSGCSQLGGNSSYVFISSGPQDTVTLQSCYTDNGQLQITGWGTVDSCTFGRSDWFNTSSSTRFVFRNCFYSGILGTLQVEGTVVGGHTNGATFSREASSGTGSGTVHIYATDGPYQEILNNGAFTLSPGTSDDARGIFNLLVVNQGSAGTITLTGWTVTTGAFDTTNGHAFHCRVFIHPGIGSRLEINNIF